MGGELHPHPTTGAPRPGPAREPRFADACTEGMNRSTLVAAAALAAALIAPATSLAGGWATVGLSSLPDGTRPGEAWVVDLTVLQHGRTPLEGVEPRVLIEAAERRDEQAFVAKPTERAGVYRARGRVPLGRPMDLRRGRRLLSGPPAGQRADRRRGRGERRGDPRRPRPDRVAASRSRVRSGSPSAPGSSQRSSRRRSGGGASRSRRRDEGRARRGARGGRAGVRCRGARRRDPGGRPSPEPARDRRRPSTSPAAPSSRAWAAAAATRSPPQARRGQIGPDLDSALEHHTRATLIAQITAPAVRREASARCPTDFGSRMDAGELDALVRFLLAPLALRRAL